MRPFVQFHEEARFLRESSGSTNIERTLLKALNVLKLFNIPHLVCGGFAVQEHGYPRFTVDVDIIVPDFQLTCDKLLLNGFRETPGSHRTVTDEETKVNIDALPGGGGGRVGPGPLTLPMPTHVSEKPQILTLPDLIALKLSSYLGSPFDRAKDYADAVELVKVNRTSRALGVDSRIQDEYHKLWDGLSTGSNVSEFGWSAR
jgi:hypothetical protein